METLPVLYSFRRCPYAIRARLGLWAAGFEPGRTLELREVDLRCRPPELQALCPAATVPVLHRPDGTVLDQSLEILQWALEARDPLGWLPAGHGPDAEARTRELLSEADGPFKHHLDRCRYPERFGVEETAGHRAAALAILRGWDRLLAPGAWLLGSRISLVDIALLPFVRQFRLADPEGFDREPGLEAVQPWLARFLASPALNAVMEPPWGERDPWHSPRRLYHLALSEDWRQARQTGLYPWSSRGLPVAEAGFVHLCRASQIAATWRRFYADAGPVRLLTLDPAELVAAGRELRDEPAPASGELFPHLYGGALPLSAVRGDAPWRPADAGGAAA